MAKERIIPFFISLLNAMTWMTVVCLVCFNLAIVSSHIFDDLPSSGLLIRNIFIVALILFSAISARLLESLALKEQEQKKELIVAHQLKRTLLSVMSHDVRGSLSSIKGILNCCSEGLMSVEDLRENSNKLTDSVDSVLALLDTMMLWSMEQNGTFTMKRKDLNLGKLVDEVFRPYAPFAERRHVHLKNEVDLETIVCADAIMLTLIIRNILANALKLTSGSSIIVRARQHAESTEIIIQDTGEGLNKRIVERFFSDRSYLSSMEINRGNSMGFGLMLCEEFIRSHGGILTYVSQDGTGATLRFTISRQVDNESEAHAFSRRTESEERVLNRIKADTGLNFGSVHGNDERNLVVGKELLLHALW